MSLPISYASWLEAMIHSADAVDVPDERLVTLPVWSLRPARISVGRKGVASDGSVAMLPVRIIWDGSSVVPVGVARDLPARLFGLGWNETFTAHIDEHGEVTGLPDGAHEASQPARSKTRLRARGSTARWEMGMTLERLTRKMMNDINRTVGAEIGSSREGALDPVLLDQVITDIHLGGVNKFGVPEDRSVIHRAIDKCLEPETFDRVEVSRYLTVRMKARATEKLRDALGDPRIGFKVRSVFREVKPATLEELLSVYNERYPGDKLGRKVALAALSTEIAPHARADQFDEENVGATEYALLEDEELVLIRR